MIQFLRLFAAFRALEVTMLAATDERNRVLNELDSAHMRNDELLARLGHAHESEILATRKFADFLAQQRYGRSVFDVVSEIPTAPKPEFQPLFPGKPHASDLAKQQEAEFFKNMSRGEVFTEAVKEDTVTQ